MYDNKNEKLATKRIVHIVMLLFLNSHIQTNAKAMTLYSIYIESVSRCLPLKQGGI